MQCGVLERLFTQGHMNMNMCPGVVCILLIQLWMWTPSCVHVLIQLRGGSPV